MTLQNIRLTLTSMYIHWVCSCLGRLNPLYPQFVVEGLQFLLISHLSDFIEARVIHIVFNFNFS